MSRDNYTVCHEDLPKSVLKSLNEQRQSNRECNFSLQGKDCVIRVHRCLIRSISPLIESLCSSDPESERFYLPFGSQAVLDVFVHYMYTGNLILNEDTILDLYHLSVSLEAWFVTKACMEYITRILTINNVKRFLHFAREHDFGDIRNLCLKYCMQHFEQLIASNEYLEVTPNEFTSIVLASDLQIHDEEALLDAIIEWVKYDLDERLPYAEQLSATIRYQLINVERLVREFENPNLRSAHEHIKSALIDLGVLAQKRARERWERQPSAATSVCSKETTVEADTNVDSTTPDIPETAAEMEHSAFAELHHAEPSTTTESTVSVPSPPAAIVHQQAILAVLGGRAGSKKSLSDILCFRMTTELSEDVGDERTPFTETESPEINLEYLPMYPLEGLPTPRRGFGAALVHNQLFVFGGKPTESMQSVHVYDVKLGEWMCGPAMLDARTWLGAAQTGYNIFAIGGCNSNGQPLNTVEFLDIRTGKWASIASMPKSRMSLAATAQKNCIFAIGGFNKSTCDRFDLVAGKWMETAPLDTVHEACCAVTNGNIPYVMGGAGPVGSMTCSEKYNLDANEWEALKAMPLPRAFSASACFGDNILVIGGRDDQDACRDVQIYSTVSQRWSLYSDILPGERAGCFAVCIDLCM